MYVISKPPRWSATPLTTSLPHLPVSWNVFAKDKNQAKQIPLLKELVTKYVTCNFLMLLAMELQSNHIKVNAWIH